MNLIEFISFIAAMLLLALSMRQKKQSPSEPAEEADEWDDEEQEQARRLREFLQAVNGEVKATSASKSAPKKPSQTDGNTPASKKAAKDMAKKQPPQASNWQAYHPTTGPLGSLQKDAYAITTARPSRAHQLVRQQKSPQDMILLQEIIGPPKAYRQEGYHGILPP